MVAPAAAHAAAIASAAPAALAAALTAKSVARCAARELHTGDTEGQERRTNGRGAGEKGGNGRRRAARAGVVVVAAAGPGKAACRRAAAAAGRVRGRAMCTPPCRHRPDRRPRCPMKDTPPEGDRAEELPKEIPSLLGRGAAVARAGARAGPTNAPIHSPCTGVAARHYYVQI